MSSRATRARPSRSTGSWVKAGTVEVAAPTRAPRSALQGVEVVHAQGAGLVERVRTRAARSAAVVGARRAQRLAERVEARQPRRRQGVHAVHHQPGQRVAVLVPRRRQRATASATGSGWGPVTTTNAASGECSSFPYGVGPVAEALVHPVERGQEVGDVAQELAAGQALQHRHHHGAAGLQRAPAERPGLHARAASARAARGPR